MNNQEKFTTRASTLKVHRSNSQTISSYPVGFSTDFPFSFLLSFAFCLVLFPFFCFFEFAVFILKLKIFILIHIRLCGQVSDKKIFTQPISGNKNDFFLPKLNVKLSSLTDFAFIGGNKNFTKLSKNGTTF